MRVRALLHEDSAQARMLRFGVNGSVAAAAHFAALWFNLRVLEMPSAGVANLCAAIVGITASFVGSRYFVFRRAAENIVRQAAKFGLLYASAAALHGGVLYLWTDLAGLDYRGGFTIALLLQIVLAYYGNARIVFKR